LRVIEQVTCCQRDALWLRRAADVKVLFAPVKPWQRIVGAIILGKLELMYCGYAVVTRVVSLPAAAGVLWSAVRWIAGWRSATFRVGGKLRLRQVNALDARRQCILLDAQFTDGLLQRGHLGLNHVDVVQPAFHGLRAVVHDRELLGDGGEPVVGLATRTLAGNLTHGGSENPSLVIPRCHRLGQLGSDTIGKTLMNVLI
jgi:hypothetical protein